MQVGIAARGMIFRGLARTVEQERGLHTEREVAFAAMAERQGRFLYRVAFGLLRHEQDAEDAVQEALLKLFRGNAWRGIAEERAFLARVVWRVGLDRLAARLKTMRMLRRWTSRPRGKGQTRRLRRMGNAPC